MIPFFVSVYIKENSKRTQGWRNWVGGEMGQGWRTPSQILVTLEGAAVQRWRATLLFAYQNFHTLLHPCVAHVHLYLPRYSIKDH